MNINTVLLNQSSFVELESNKSQRESIRPSCNRPNGHLTDPGCFVDQSDACRHAWPTLWPPLIVDGTC